LIRLILLDLTLFLKYLAKLYSEGIVNKGTVYAKAWLITFRGSKMWDDNAKSSKLVASKLLFASFKDDKEDATVNSKS
jgi:hypothetical protein